MRKPLAAFAVLALSGCVTAPPTSRPVPKERAPECAWHCENLGMRLGAIVIIVGATGCVCEPKDAAGAGSRAGGAAAAAGAVVIAAQQQQQR